MKIQNKFQDYTYVYEENNPRSLVILQDYHNVIEEMFRNNFNTFIWVSSEGQIDSVIVQDIEKTLEISIKYFEDMEQVRQYVENCRQKNQKILSYVIICSLTLKKRIEMFVKQIETKPAKVLVFYPSMWDKKGAYSSEEEKQEDQYTRQEQQNVRQDEGEANKINEKVEFEKIKRKNQFMECLQGLKIRLQEKELPNFVSLSKDIRNSNIMFKTMLAMVNQNIQGNSKKMLVKEMARLLLKISQHNPKYTTYKEKVTQFLQEIAENSLTGERAFFWYTAESSIYRFINNLLRSTKSPAQTFYIQPYFCLLFSCVESQFKIFCKQNARQNKKIVCYRGGSISLDQINFLYSNNIGDSVQNLGFLSTSRSEEVAGQFIGNAMFQIHIDCLELNENSPGFAQIHRESYFAVEEEILFNSLNTFTILQVFKKNLNQKSIFYIKLAYGGLQNEKSEEDIYEKQYNQNNQRQQYIQSLKEIRFQMKNKIKCQGESLINDLQVLSGSKFYWQKYCQISSTCEERLYGLINLAICKLSESKFDQVLELMNERQEILKQKQKDIGQKLMIQVGTGYSKSQKNNQRKKMELHMAQNFNLIGITYAKLGNLTKALYHFQRSLQLRKKVEGERSLNYAKECKNLANIYEQLGKSDRACQLYNTAMQIHEQQNMEKSPQYASLLHSVGIFYHRQGNIRSALAFLEESRQRSLTILGENNLEHIRTLRAIALIHKEMGWYRLALKLLEKCKNLNSLLATQNSSDILDLQFEIANVHFLNGNAEKALQFHMKFKQQSMTVYGEKHIKTAINLVQIAKSHQNIGNYRYALKYFAKAQEIFFEIQQKQPNYLNKLQQNQHRIIAHRMFLFYPVYRVQSWVKSYQKIPISTIIKQLLLDLHQKSRKIYQRKDIGRNYLNLKMIQL